MGREGSRAVGAEFVDMLVNSMHLDFAFVRLCNPDGGAAVEIRRGSAIVCRMGAVRFDRAAWSDLPTMHHVVMPQSLAWSNPSLEPLFAALL